jgi:LPS-assembly lipoprotein
VRAACPHRRRLLGTASAALLLGGCGFHLRRPPALPFASIALTGFAPRSPLEAELRRQLATVVVVKDAPAAAEVVLHALTDRRERSVAGSTAAGEVREIQLRVHAVLRADARSGRPLIAPFELRVARDLSYIESAALAKAQEEAELFRDMQADVVAQVLQRLAAVQI